MIKMRVRCLIFSALCGAIATPLVISTPRVLAAPAQSNTAREFQTIYNGLERAFLRRDANAVIALQTSDFKQRNARGRVQARRQADAGLRRAMTAIKSFDSMKYTVLGVKTMGNKAMVSHRQEYVAVLRGPKSRTARLKTVSRNQDTWIKTPRGWRIQFSDTQSSKSTINGRSVG